VHSDHLLLDRDNCRKQGVAIDVFWTRPERSFTEIARVEAVRRWYVYSTWQDVQLALCREARELGADAIYSLHTGSAAYSISVGELGGGGSTEKLTATAIRWGD
jgi:hypothetical protein